MEENITKKLKHYPKNPKGRWICKCGGPKQWASAICQSCRLANKRPPIDPQTYHDEHGTYRRVPCTQMQYALVSSDKYEKVIGHLWLAVFDKSINNFYVMTTINGKRVRLHRFLAGDSLGKVVDHKNHQTLDCRDHNIRVADECQSMANQRLRRDNKSGYRGVWYREKRACWCGMVTFRGKHYYTPHCKTALEAAIEYNKLAAKLHGEFACLNKIAVHDDQATMTAIPSGSYASVGP